MEQKDVFNDFQLNLAVGLCAQISIAVSNIRAYEKIQRQLEEIQRYKAQLEEENFYLQEEIRISYPHHEVLGAGSGLKKCLQAGIPGSTFRTVPY